MENTIYQKKEELTEKNLQIEKLKRRIEKTEERFELNSELLDNTNVQARELGVTIQVKKFNLNFAEKILSHDS